MSNTRSETLAKARAKLSGLREPTESDEAIIVLIDENVALRARVAQLEAALLGLVYRLDEVHEDLAYKAVWTSYMLHGGRYQGPTYVDALAEARAALKDAPQ